MFTSLDHCTGLAMGSKAITSLHSGRFVVRDSLSQKEINSITRLKCHHLTGSV